MGKQGPVSDLTNLELADQLVVLEAEISRLEAERCSVLAEFAVRKASREFEYSSPSAFLIGRCRIAPARATRLVAQAHALAEMPGTTEAWSDGRLASDQMRILLTAHQAAPAVFPAHEEMLVDTCSELGIVDTGRAVAYWRQAADGFEEEAERQHSQRRVHLSETFGGMWRLDGYLDPVAGETLKTALDGLTPPRAEADGRSAPQRRADALCDLARTALDSGELPVQGGEKPHLLIHVAADRLGGGSGGLAETASGTVLSQAALDLLACDCAFSRIVFGPGSEVLDLGRKTRLISPALRRAVIARDRHCQHPTCRRPAKWCDVDHIVPWALGGPTNLENLQLLCRFHHQLKHQKAGRFSIPTSRGFPSVADACTYHPLR